MRSLACALVLALLIPVRLFAAAPVYSNNFAAVTLDGVRLGTDLDPSNYSMFPSVVYDPQSGVFHMWVAASNALSIEGLRHATSSDGVHFISDGNLSFAGGSPFPIYGAPTEPQFEFPRAARIGSDWKLLIWTENGAPGQFGDYNYNESVNDIGIDPGTLAVAHQGPVYPTNGAGTYGQTTGPFGMVNGALYVQDDRVGGISKWDYDDTTPPSVATPADASQDLITGTGFVYFLTHPGDPLGVYVHNVGRVLDQGDGTLGVYYSLRHPDGSRVNKQIYYAQSGDGGQTWSAPVGLFSNGDAVRVDGAPNQFDFSHPEVTLVGFRRVLYFSTKAADGAYVVATSAAQAAQPGSWSGIYGSGVNGLGENGRAVTRTTGGGYAIVADSSGFVAGGVAYWLLKLSSAGDVEWQKTYTFGSGALFNIHALAEAQDGGLVMAGTAGAACDVAWLVKVDSLGSVVWSKTYATNDPSASVCQNGAYALVRTSDDGFAFSGLVTGNFGVAKIDAAGNLQWIRTYPGGASGSVATTLVEAPDGGLAAAGSWISPATQNHAYRILKADGSGVIQWQETFGGTQGDSLQSIANGVTEGFVATGHSETAGGIWTIALNDDGTVAWQKTYLGISSVDDSGHGIVQSPNGGYTIAASLGAGVAAMLEVDGGGSPVWGRQFAANATVSSTFQALASTVDAGFLAVGNDKDANGVISLLAVKVDSGGAFVGCLNEELSVDFSQGPTSVSPVSLSDGSIDETPNTTVTDVAATTQDTDAPERLICSGTLPQVLAPAALAVDPAGNGVADPGEQFVAEPAWTNESLLATSLSGQTSAYSDSNGLDTGAPDPNAGYGTVASLATSDCAQATGDCYRFQFLNAPRPSQHWDTYADETLTTSDPHHQFAKRWVIHIGESFSDVSPSSGFYPFIEDIFHNGITAGCGGLDYCPTSSTTRAQMAVFLLKSKHGASFTPPACTGIFGDVPCPSLFVDWIEELYAEGITGGCSSSPLLYCPDAAVTRQQMSAFLLKALNGSGYVPPLCTGLFGDVACPSLFADWIEDLYNRHITAGCSTSPLLYCPTDPNTRQQMAVFLTKTFSLILYGP